MIIDVKFHDDVPIPPAVMLQALRQLVHSLESNLQRKPDAPFISMGGELENGRVTSWLHFHTDVREQFACKAGLEGKPSGDRDE